MEDYHELGKHMANGLYKTFVEDYKEEKTLKESLFLKDIRKELRIIQDGTMNQKSPCSDS